MSRLILAALTVSACACAGRTTPDQTEGAPTTTLPTTQPRPIPPELEWPWYGRTPYGDRHSALSQIDTTNVSGLVVAWRVPTPGEAAPVPVKIHPHVRRQSLR